MTLQVNPISGPVGYVAAPISINQDGSLTLNISLGLLDDKGAIAQSLGNQSHYLNPKEAALVLDEPVGEESQNQSPRQVLLARCIAVLTAKGEWKL